VSRQLGGRVLRSREHAPRAAATDQEKFAMTRSISRWLLVSSALVAAVLAGEYSHVFGGGAFFNNRSVGGVAVDAEGVVEAPTVQDNEELDKLRRETDLDVPAALEEFTERRAVSLKQLEATLQRCHDEMKPVPDEVLYVAGLQRVQYVFIYPERNDIVLVGPAEGWKFDGLGNVVGLTTNRPVLLLDDLMAALRSGASSRLEPITCSIDPTPEGIQQLQALTSRLRTIGNPDETLARIEEALGPQMITVTGVPATSHFARTMVAADFRMKRLAMNFDPAPVEGLPSFLNMMKSSGRGMRNMMPRWWLAPNYQPLAKTDDGLAWELRGPGVKCMTAENYVNESGQTESSGEANPVAERWAATMTEKFGELAEHDSSFGQLRNIMDLAVVGALIEKERLLDIADLKLPRLMGGEELVKFPAPKQTSSKASAVKQGRDWLISASGGVEMLPWHIASESETVAAVGEIRQEFAAEVNEFWWE
jgi:hypothetical protein